MQSTALAHVPAQEPWTTIHPLSEPDRAAMVEQRAAVEPNKGKLRGTAARATFDAIIGRTAAPPDVTFRNDSVGGIAGWWCEPTGAPARTAILHLHGGWFNWGTAQAFRHLVGHIARHVGVRAFVPDYRLAPEHPFPSAIEDAIKCFEGLVHSGIHNLALTGDSAGGNLALELLTRIASEPVAGACPVGAVVFSPVTDLALTGETWASRATADPYFVREQVEGLVSAYLDGHDPRDPLVSPLYSDPAGLPAIRVHVGDDEVLLDDARRYVARAVAVGVDATLDIWQGMPHGFVGGVGHLQASTEALHAIGTFLAARLGIAR